MFERFTTQARSVVMAAAEAAALQGADRVGPQHLLLGVLGAAEPSSAAAALKDAGATHELLWKAVAEADQDARLLAKLGIDLEEVKRQVERSFGEGSWSRRRGKKGHIPFAPDAKKALELSLRHALALKSKSIEAGHVLLGVLDSGTMAAETLHAVGVEPAQVKRRVLEGLRTAS